MDIFPFNKKISHICLVLDSVSKKCTYIQAGFHVFFQIKRFTIYYANKNIFIMSLFYFSFIIISLL